MGVNPWDGVYMDVLDYLWGVVAEFWTGIDALVPAADVRVAIEMHPRSVVFSPVTLERLVQLTGATNLGSEMDPSHLMWQGMDVVAGIRRLGPLVFHAAAKDAAITPGVDVRGVLDTSFRLVPSDAPDKVPTGTGFWCSAAEDPAWRFMAVGVGHDVDWWTEFLRALAEIDPSAWRTGSPSSAEPAAGRAGGSPSTSPRKGPSSSASTSARTSRGAHGPRRHRRGVRDRVPAAARPPHRLDGGSGHLGRAALPRVGRAGYITGLESRVDAGVVLR